MSLTCPSRSFSNELMGMGMGMGTGMGIGTITGIGTIITAGGMGKGGGGGGAADSRKCPSSRLGSPFSGKCGFGAPALAGRGLRGGGGVLAAAMAAAMGLWRRTPLGEVCGRGSRGGGGWWCGPFWFWLDLERNSFIRMVYSLPSMYLWQ